MDRFVTQEEVDYLLATAGTDMSFIDNSGLASIAALEKVLHCVLHFS
jgi:hypothetical protein